MFAELYGRVGGGGKGKGGSMLRSAYEVSRMGSSDVVASTIPLVLLADGLPSVAGLGTRDTALQLLLSPDNPEALLAMSLIWSTGLVVVRSIIGLAHLWIGQLLGISNDENAA